MKTILKMEEVVMALFAGYLIGYVDLSLSWWVWLMLFFSPDISMLGYLINTRFGAVSYNLFHHKGIALLVLFAGWMMVNPALQATGLLLFSHASFDRVFGYGLKYADDFKHTSLGWITTKN